MGVRPPAFEGMRSLLGDAIGMRTARDEPGVAWFEMEEGEIQIYEDTDVDHPFFGPGPTAGFEVTDVHETRTEMRAAGIESSASQSTTAPPSGTTSSARRQRVRDPRPLRS